MVAPPYGTAQRDIARTLIGDTLLAESPGVEIVVGTLPADLRSLAAVAPGAPAQFTCLSF
jgi:hypothetical protein